MSDLKFKSKHIHKYYIFCANCGYDKVNRGRLNICPKCKINLHEKRYLM